MDEFFGFMIEAVFGLVQFVAEVLIGYVSGDFSKKLMRKRPSEKWVTR